jgi:hypothetical protein
VKKHEFMTNNDDAEFEKEVFLHVLLGLTKKLRFYKKISNNQNIDFLRKIIFAYFYTKTCFDPNNFC